MKSLDKADYQMQSNSLFPVSKLFSEHSIRNLQQVMNDELKDK